MAKTIRLLSTYKGYKPGDIITVDDAIAAQLLPYNATENLTGGTQAFQPSPGTGLSSGTNLPPAQTITSGQTSTIVFPAGSALSMQGSSSIAGNYQIMNPDGTAASTTPLVVGLNTTGVFLRDTSVKFSVTFGSLDVSASVTGGKVDLDTQLAGENLLFDWQKTEAGATESGGTVLPGRIDQVLGSQGAATDYLKRLNVVVSSPTDSRVVLKEGIPTAKKEIYTHGATASTTTVINTAANPDAVVANQYQHHLVRVGAGPYRKILAHAAFAQGAVNSYTLDQALDTAPGTNVIVVIEDPALVTEVVPLGASVNPHPVPVERHCRGAGWRVSTGTTVHCVPSGDFDNV